MTALTNPQTDGGRAPGPMDLLRAVVDDGRFAGLPAAAQAVYVVLVRHADEELRAFPKQSTIAARAGISITTAKRGIRHLVNAGAVKIEKQGGGRSWTVYALTWSEWIGGASGGKSPEADRPDGGRTRPRRGATGDPAGGPPVAYMEGTIEDDHRKRGAGARSVPESDHNLFGDHATVELLISRGKFTSVRDVKKLVGQYGAARCREALANAEYIDQLGEIRKSRTHAIVSFLRSGQGPDPRQLAAHQRDEHRRREADTARDTAERQYREAEQVRDAWERMTDADRARHRAALLAEMSEGERQALRSLSMSHPITRGLIIAHAQGDER